MVSFMSDHAFLYLAETLNKAMKLVEDFLALCESHGKTMDEPGELQFLGPATTIWGWTMIFPWTLAESSYQGTTSAASGGFGESAPLMISLTLTDVADTTYDRHVS
jgi:hypothetical protein